MSAGHIGDAVPRVDGPLKVTGQAHYAAEYDTPGLLHGYLVSSAIARGRITRLDDGPVRAMPGVVDVFSHVHKPRMTRLGLMYKDPLAPPGQPFRPFHGPEILHSGQPIALIVADSFENARDAASQLVVEYAATIHETDLDTQIASAYAPPSKRMGIPGPPDARGDANAAFRASPVTVDAAYDTAAEYHNPMEPIATTVVWEGHGRITVYDKSQGAQNVQLYLRDVFGFRMKHIRVVNKFVGGAFGIALRPQLSVFMAVMAAKALGRSVRVELTRDQMFALATRPLTKQHVRLGAATDGVLLSLAHGAIAATSRYEDHQEVVVNFSGALHRCPNVEYAYKLAKLDITTPTDMRAPGAAIGSFAIESAMDELSHALHIDPVELRRINYTERDDDQDKEFTSKALRGCLSQGAERFGWANRTMQPGSMRDGTELIGWGMATAAWDARMAPYPSRARVTLEPSGRFVVESSTCDIGTGTYTILTQIAADALGVPATSVATAIGDSRLPLAQVAGGSWTAASTGSAVHEAADKLRTEVLRRARRIDGSPLAGARRRDLEIVGGIVRRIGQGGAGVSLTDIVAANGDESLASTATAIPNLFKMHGHIGYAHSAVFVEVRVDELLGVIRVTRVVNAVAAGRILNPLTARSQVVGGVVMGIGQALHEEAMTDHRLGRVMNHNMAEYHVPTNADVGAIDVIFVDEKEERVSPIGVKGIGEIGIVGTAAAIANAVFHATGRRVRQLPITIEHLL